MPTFLGVICGIPAGLWLNRLIERRSENRQKELHHQRKIQWFVMLKEMLETNLKIANSIINRLNEYYNVLPKDYCRFIITDEFETSLLEPAIMNEYLFPDNLECYYKLYKFRIVLNKSNFQLNLHLSQYYKYDTGWETGRQVNVRTLSDEFKDLPDKIKDILDEVENQLSKLQGEVSIHDIHKSNSENP
ncbi:hypothetical protein K9N50_04595 [bacterium]|nr:hypothetical protein [bacterium]